MTFRECGKVSFPTGKLTFLKCEKRIQETLLYACEFHVLRSKVAGKDAIRRHIIVLFKRHFAIRAKCSFPHGKTHVSRVRKSASRNRAFCGSNVQIFRGNVEFQKQGETGCKWLTPKPPCVSLGSLQASFRHTPPPWQLDEQCGVAVPLVDPTCVQLASKMDSE